MRETDPTALRERLRSLRVLITDVDGVLTRGDVVYTGDDSESKTFNVRDGSACHIAALIGLPVVVVTARSSAAVARRFRELPVLSLHQGVFDKLSVCLALQAELGVAASQMAYLGDDLVDLPSMRHCGLAIAAADAHPRILAEADWVTAARGGEGAFREVVDAVVEARDLWDTVVADYFRRQGAS